MNERMKYAKISSAVGLTVDILLGVSKFLCGLFMNSIAIIADGVHSLTDSVADIATYLGFKIASSKPDKEHPFGHGRFEYISGAVVSIIILIAGYELIRSSIIKMFSPEEPIISSYVFYILFASILLKLFTFFLNRNFSKKINSAALKAIANDSIMDCFATAAVIISSFLYMMYKINIDSYIGALVGLLIIRTGIISLKETISPLLGQAPQKEFVDDIKEIVKSHEQVLDMHDLVVHDYGPGRIMVSLHAEVPAEGDILELHDDIDNIEKELEEKLNCKAVIHMDPVVTTDSKLEELKEKMERFIKGIDKSLSFHDFRMVPGKTHTNLIFDLVIPFGKKLNEKDVEDKIYNFIKKLSKGKKEKYYAVINIEPGNL